MMGWLIRMQPFRKDNSFSLKLQEAHKMLQGNFIVVDLNFRFEIWQTADLIYHRRKGSCRIYFLS